VLRLPALATCVTAAAALVACGSSSSRAATESGRPRPATGAAATPRATPSLSSLGVFGPPTGTVPAARPRAVVLILHGGGWAATTPRVLQEATGGTEGYRAGGFATLTLRMRAGRGAIDSATTAYDAARRRYGPRVPICAIGASTGGHVALMLAVVRPRLACVVANAAPTDLALWGREVPAAEPQIAGYFGRELRRFSPAQRGGDVRARVLLQYAANDRDVPADQGRAFRDARPAGTRLVVLPAGSAPWAHSAVDPRALRAVYPRQERALRAAARAAGR
jgi:dienelactone hydrolase